VGEQGHRLLLTQRPPGFDVEGGGGALDVIELLDRRDDPGCLRIGRQRFDEASAPMRQIWSSRFGAVSRARNYPERMYGEAGIGQPVDKDGVVRLRIVRYTDRSTSRT